MQAIINGEMYEVEPAVKVILDRVMCENNELKHENKRLEEGYQKSIGVIAATDCVECKKDADPVKHGELWVSCSERMPETLTETLDGRYSDCCLVFAEETEWIGMAYYRTNNSESWWEFADAQNKPKIDWAEITHWMPLPNCPNCGAKMDESEGQ